MLTNEDLKAIETIMDKKVGKVETRLDQMDKKFDMVEVGFDQTGKKVDVIEQKIDREIMESELRMSQMMDRKLEPLQKEIHMIRVDLLENNIIPRLNSIEQCYLSTYDRYAVNADKIESMNDDISVLKAVVSDHAVQLKRLPCNV
ncbi:MAG: hypothetical protein ACI4SD_02505 [Suilimivivens sp.]